MDKQNARQNLLEIKLEHDLRYSLDISKIEKLGWKPKTRFEEGIKKTIEWYVKNEWWWKPIIEREQIDFHEKI